MHTYAGACAAACAGAGQSRAGGWRGVEGGAGACGRVGPRACVACGRGGAREVTGALPPPRDTAPPLEQRAAVSAYYAALQSAADLRTSACTLASAPPPAVRAIVAKLHPAVVE